MRVIAKAICISALVCLPAWSQALDAAQAPVEVVSPADVATFTQAAGSDIAPVVVSTYAPLREKYAGHEQLLLKYRKSDNLPEISSEMLLTGEGDAKTAARINAGKESIGFIPRLTILPCDTGCKGNSDYDKAVKNFVKNYDLAVKKGLFAYRGQMTVKVRWFNERGYFKKQAGLLGGRDVFAISFPLEGKLVTMSYEDGSTQSDMDALVVRASGELWMMLSLEMGKGVKPSPLHVLLPQSEQNFLRSVNNTLRPVMAALDNLFGLEDRRSRLEPMTDADVALLPAVDGILPNEVDPLDKVVYFHR